ncbi:MAG: hypothetical protein ROZ09_01715 [Thiobacillus sp.]|jgi:hypothetical protein|uniref:hypothetical protein n=1 Tax=Thiobacillus sp. TaxID=924 RepID=UPI0028943527|nr:hypothetical protein [Thiobacillus sp.]MDT3705512.1 hypothetical protein [Thiobacillus sp.]
MLARLMLVESVDKTGGNRTTMRSILASVLALAAVVAATSVAAAEPEQPRLKYRSKSLTCTCANGMSEADIRKAWEARFPQSQGAPLDSLDGRPQTRDEHKGGR